MYTGGKTLREPQNDETFTGLENPIELIVALYGNHPGPEMLTAESSQGPSGQLVVVATLTLVGLSEHADTKEHRQ